jgi:hypothetical protein
MGFVMSIATASFPGIRWPIPRAVRKVIARGSSKGECASAVGEGSDLYRER